MKKQVRNLLRKHNSKNLRELSEKLNISYTRIKNWSCGRTKFGSKGKYKIVKIPEMLNDDIAELVGVILGDGNLNKKDIRIVGNTSERSYYLHLKSLFQKVFDVNSIIRCDTENSVKLTVYSVRISEYLTSLGLKIGDKIKNKVVIPQWIFENKDYIKSCLRGLFDTDGSFFTSSNNTEYNILWKMGTGSLLPEYIRKALLELDFHPTKVFGNGRKISLCRKDEIVRFFNEIKPRNNVHLMRYRKYFN
jgi:intein/homing endonuclease